MGHLSALLPFNWDYHFLFFAAICSASAIICTRGNARAGIIISAWFLSGLSGITETKLSVRLPSLLKVCDDMQKSLPLHQQPLISETKRLAVAVASVAATITEPINTKLKAAIESGTDFPRASQANAGSQNAIEGWVKKTDVAKHLNVSLRTINNLMKKGVDSLRPIRRATSFLQTQRSGWDLQQAIQAKRSMVKPICEIRRPDQQNLSNMNAKFKFCQGFVR
jgi:hypothetical protein